MKKNEQYSHRDFTGQSLTGVPVEQLNGTTVVGSCFYQEWKPGELCPRCDIFPDRMQGVRFVRCNLDNVYIPPGNTVVKGGADGCSTRRIKAQADGEDWVLDQDDQPIEPTDANVYRKFGLEVPKPQDLPKQQTLTKPQIRQRRQQKQDMIQKARRSHGA